MDNTVDTDCDGVSFNNGRTIDDCENSVYNDEKGNIAYFQL
ncbi:MAG: hypothetical protein PF693_09380 [Spirochaetia bacterium]|jgi:hypothetical protein|nr:hypothetical protein [Spirochaetia bacterium]